MPEDQYRRRSARVLLIAEDAPEGVEGRSPSGDMTADDRVLLFRFRRNRRKPDTDDPYWLTPGGGVDDGESPREAAARELLEEVGLRVAPEGLGPMVATTSGYADLGWAKGRFRDDFFLHRITAHTIDTGGLEPHERTQITGHRWWSVAELAATAEVVYPFGLVPLLTDLLAGRIPDEPVRLPWHH